MKGLIPSRGDRPADIFIPSFTQGHDTALDVTVVSPLQTSLVSQAAREPGVALQTRHTDKLRKHQQSCHQMGLVFTPLVCSTFGAWHEKAVEVFKLLSHAVSNFEGSDSGDVAKSFFARLSVKLWQGNAALINSRHPVNNIPPPWMSGEQQND